MLNLPKPERIYCLNCKWDITKIRSNSNQKFCSIKCLRKYRYKKDKNKIIIRAKEWALKNKEKHRKIRNKAVLKQYHKNPLKYKERSFVDIKRDKIQEILGTICKQCKNKADHFHHIKYDNLPRDNLKKYCKFLLPLCRKCHQKIHFKK